MNFDKFFNIFGLMVTGGVAVAIVTNKNSSGTISAVMNGFARNFAIACSRCRMAVRQATRRGHDDGDRPAPA